ncbi:conserved hypothetical protein [Ricinus communis]|uniref:Uncharacterized protein n=1 Tax=Ricinus communis TaxID=3988 RepID=B9SSA2_RICCO|nr:conserved hypothetical protein [Ricinus communis]
MVLQITLANICPIYIVHVYDAKPCILQEWQNCSRKQRSSYRVLKGKSLLLENCRTLPQREPFQKFSKAKGKPGPKRGFGNSFQPAIDAPRLEPH